MFILPKLFSLFTNREPDVTLEKAKFFSGILCCDDAKARHELGYHSGLDKMIHSAADG